MPDLSGHVKGSHGGNIVVQGEDALIEIPLHKCRKCKFTTRDPVTLEEHERNDHNDKIVLLKKTTNRDLTLMMFTRSSDSLISGFIW